MSGSVLTLFYDILKKMRSSSSFLKIAGVGFLILILITIGVLILLRRQQPTTQTPTTSSPQPTNSSTTNQQTLSVNTTVLDQSTTVNSQFNQFEQQAYEFASKWNKNASLCAASIKMTADLNPNALTYSYIYCAPENKTFYFNINFNTQGQFLRALVWQTDYLKPDLLKINRKYLKLTLTEALGLAEQNGGSSFRASHPQAVITLNLYRAQPKNYLYWFVQYEDTLSPDQLVKKIDAYTGELVSE